ncbi:hypothetical protein [Streptomyces griseorubiginosus]|uniref:hypothetical protein n=1 Tax=Streptomyces griseorubiginosus TaxID=67304 RepID=UPI00331A762F
MTAAPELPASGPAGAGVNESAAEDAWETARTDAALAAQAMSAAVFLAGLIANGQLETVGRPDKLPADLFPGDDPEVVERAFQRGMAVGLHAGRVSRDPLLYRDQFARVQAELEAVGFAAMGRLVGRSLRLVAPHPADGEGARVRATGVTSRTTDTSWEQGDKR